MEENKTTKLNNVAADLPEVPRDEAGNIIIEQIAIGQDDKKRYIVPDDIFDNYYRELPEGTRNKTGTFFTYNKGKIRTLGSNPEADKEIQRSGANALNANLSQRRSNKEVIDILLRRKAPKEALERLGLPEDATMIEAANLAQILEALKGNTKAMEYLRDTVGEKPTTEINAEVTAVTPEDQELMKRVAARLEKN